MLKFYMSEFFLMQKFWTKFQLPGIFESSTLNAKLFVNYIKSREKWMTTYL